MVQQADFKRIVTLTGEEGLQKLHQATVAMVGLGSLGSKTVVELASAGIGHFILIDPDSVEAHNCARSAYDLRYVGWKKVEACKDLILNRYPKAEVTVSRSDVLKNTSRKLRGADLVVVAGIGSEIATGKLAAILRTNSSKALFGGLYEKAIAGDIFYVDPLQNGPCYHCFASQVSDVRPETRANVNYGMAPDELKAQPGLGVDVAFVAAAMAKWALRIVINNPKIIGNAPGNYLILANERHQLGVDAHEKPVFMRPSTGIWYTIPKLEGCNVCGSKPQSLSDISDIL